MENFLDFVAFVTKSVHCVLSFPLYLWQYRTKKQNEAKL